MTRKRKTEQRKNRKLKELDKKQQLKKENLERKVGGDSQNMSQSSDVIAKQRM